MKIVEGMVSRKSRRDSANLLSGSKRSAGLLLALTLIFGVLPATPSLAENCTKANAVKVVSGVKFVCKKTGGKLKWVRQGSNSVVNNQPTTPSPSPTKPSAKEWTKCPAAGRVSGSGAATLSCVKVNGRLQWVKNTTLDTPSLRKPCRTEGAVGPWRDEFLICTKDDGGRIWDFPAEDFYADPAPPSNVATISYTITSPMNSCYSREFWMSVLETRSQSGDWVTLKPANWISWQTCNSGFGRFQLIADLTPGTAVRMRVYTNSYGYISDPLILTTTRDVQIQYFSRYKMTPFTNWVSTQNIVGTSGNFGLEYVDYEWVNQETILTYRLSASSNAFRWNSISAVQTDRGGATIVSQPVSGTVISPSGLIQIRLKIDTIYLFVNRVTFDLTGLNGSTSFTKRVATDFTWR